MFQWVESHYQFFVVGIPAILAALWKWVLMPMVRAKQSFSAWLVRDTTIKVDMGEFLKKWSPDGEDSGFERLKRIEANSELLRATQMVRDSLDSTARFTCNEKGHVINANRAFCRYFNITEDVATGWGWINLFSPEGDCRDQFRRQWIASVDSSVEFMAMVRTNPHHDHHSTAVEICASPVRDTTGEVIRWDGVMVPASKAPVAAD